MTIFVTSDCHFGHKNILSYCTESRPFSNTDIHDAVIIENWNNTVSPEDTVYVLGDFFMGPLTLIDSVLPQLNGKIRLITGNHDEKRRIERYKQYGVEVIAWKEGYYLFYDGITFFMHHFPVEENFDYLKDSAEVYLYGHVHDKAPRGLVKNKGNLYTYHVGVDTNSLTPVSLDEIAAEYHKECNHE